MNRINTIRLGVRDMRASSRFYRDGLGFETDERLENPKLVFFDTQGTKFELFPIENLMGDIGLRQDEEPAAGYHGIVLTYNTKEKEEVDQVIQLVRNAGANVMKEAQETTGGCYHAFFSDPDSYIWEVAWSPDFTFDNNNMIEI